MSRGRQHALTRLEGLLPRVLEHLAKLRDEPGAVAMGHWRGEVRVWLDEMTDLLQYVGRRTRTDWERRLAELRTELGEGG